MVENGELLEWAEVFGNLYGTPRAPVEQALAAGRDVLFDIDWQGTQQLREKARGDMASVFVLPPSMPELERRLHTRALDDERRDQGPHGESRRRAQPLGRIRLRRSSTTTSNGRLREVRADPGCRAAQARAADRTVGLRPQAAGEGCDHDAGGMRALNSARQPDETLQPEFLGARGRLDAPRLRAAPAARRPSDFRLWRSILRRWPKAASVTRCRALDVAGQRRRGGEQARPATTSPSAAARRPMAAMSNRMRASRAPAGEHRQPAVASSSPVRRRCAPQPRAGTSAPADRTRAARARW